jgi:hypothetical protein
MVGRGGGDRTIKPIADTYVIHSTFRSIRKNRMSEVHGGYMGRVSGHSVGYPADSNLFLSLVFSLVAAPRGQIKGTQLTRQLMVDCDFESLT